VRNSSGFAVAALVVFLFYESYFSRDLLPPVDRVFAATIEAGADPGIAGTLLVWAVPGALIQLLGGRGTMYVLAGGFIAGSALTSFGTATARLR
jgi:uncharacterized oligopeptide transporter (OPT) family protein